MNGKFISIFAHHLKSYIEMRRSLGYKCISEVPPLIDFDRFAKEHSTTYITKGLFDSWSIPKPYNAVRTTIARYNIVRAFAKYLNNLDSRSYLPPPCQIKSYSNFSPYIFTKTEINNIFTQADSIPPSKYSPLRHLVVPAVLRMLYCCGFRINEVVSLKVKDVDWINGIVFVHNGKGEKDRLVPMNELLLDYLKDYINKVPCVFHDEDWLFPSKKGQHYNHGSFYWSFRELLFLSNISHGGRGKGPRLHDLRHTFAVHCFEKLIKADMEPMQILPILAAYLGHKNYKATCLYLHLTAEIFPDIVKKTELKYGELIPSAGGEFE
jgi:integrase/recombinase XerD